MKKILLSIIRFYKRFISPYKGVACCRFVPTCSQYAYEAIEKYGCIKGSFLAAKRLLKCRPFGGGGYDPVP